jgi:type I restriction enzyme S subunit
MNNQVAEVSAKYLAEVEESVVTVGYKQTEVGLIPEDWEVTQLSNLCERISVGLATSVTKYYRSKGVPIVRNMNIKDGYFDGTDMLYLAPEFAKANLSKAANVLDVITVHTGSNIGLTCVLPEGFDNCQTFTTLITTTKKKVLNPFYLSLHMASQDGKNEIARLQVGGGKGNLNTGELKQYLISYPKSIEEQTAIANALSDVDALITELEKLVAKKQAIKTATMQQLLTGRTRLPQFALREDGTPKGTKPSELGEMPEDWEVVTLGDIGQTVIGLTYSPNDVADFGTLVLRSSNVQNGKLAYADNVYVNMDLPERVIVKQGDILVCVRNGSRQLIGKCALIDKDAEGSAFGAFMSIFRTKYSVFVFYQFQSDLIQNQINEIMGATINQITNKDMFGFKITLPSDEKEQTAIATTLSDMDAEIQELEQRLSKTRQIKQGMMQELLTGRTRLI